MSANSSSFVITPASPSKIAFVQQPPAEVTLGKPISPPVKVAIEDLYGNIVSSNKSQVIVTVNGLGSNITGVNAVGGVATFNNLVIKIGGMYILIASDGSLTGAKSTDFTMIPPDPIVGPSQNAAVDTKYSVPLFAKVTDDLSGAPLANMVVTFTAPATGPSGTFAGKRTVTVRTNAAGVATAPTFAANTTAGNFVVTVGFAGATPPETIALTNVAGPPTHVTAAGGTPQSIVVDTSLDTPLSAKVTDRFGNPVTGASVNFTAPISSPSGTFTGNLTTVTVTTNSLGIAIAPTFTASTKAGAYAVFAMVSGITAEAKYQLMNVAGAPVNLIVGSTMSAVVGDAYSHPLTATVTDAYGNTIRGVHVAFTVPGSGASGTFSKKRTVTVMTNADGVAAAPTFTANNTSGLFLVEVSALGMTSGFIQLTNLPRPA
jgi:Invasin, domain 3